MAKSWTVGADVSFHFIHDCQTGETQLSALQTFGAFGGAFDFWDEQGEDLYDDRPLS